MEARGSENRSWRLEDFLGSLIGELDQAQDVLALKGVNRPLTYTVKDLALELQLFPVYSGDSVLFATARPGETGAAKVSIALGSITDRQIRETTRLPAGKDDVDVERIEEIDPDTRRELKKIGVKSARDLERMEERDIDLGKLSSQKLDYKNLAQVIARAKRRGSQPRVDGLSLDPAQEGLVLSVSGRNLALGVEPETEGQFPMVLLNRRAVPVVHASSQQIGIAVCRDDLVRGSNELAIALDPYSIIRLDVKA